jgi:hypothetical protein
MINMNIFFETMLMILKNRMFKVDFFKMQIIHFYLFSWPKKQSKVQVYEMLIFSTFLVNGHLKFTYALSTSKVIIIIYQSFNVEIFFNTIPMVNFKNIFDLFLVH